MNTRESGDALLVSNRAYEKTDLQNLNHRLAAYIQAVRSAQERQNQQSILDSRHAEVKLSDSVRSQYELQITDLQVRLEEVSKEKVELEIDRAHYDTAVNDYEARILSLNGNVFEKQNELQRLHSALAAKEVELQQARSDVTQPKMALEGARLDIEDFRKRLEEAERKLQLEVTTNATTQQELSGIRGKMKQESMLHRQELADLEKKLENSRTLILQLEENTRKAGLADVGLTEMMSNVREASEAELRRFMEDTEAKYSLNIREIKMRMDADAQSLVALVGENAKLQAQIDSHAADVRTLEAKLSIAEEQKSEAISALRNEQSSFQLNARNLERKLQETQDLLLIKIQELGLAQEANIPLRAEINALKALIEAEEKRLELGNPLPEGLSVSSLIGRNPLTQSRSFMEMLGSETRRIAAGSLPITQPADLSARYQGGSALPTSLNDGIDSRRPASVPVTAAAFQQGTLNESSLSHVPLATPTFLRVKNGEIVGTSENKTSSSAESPSGQLFDLKEGMKTGQLIGLEELPPRPENPTPDRLPCRSQSAINSRYVPAAGGQGKDYFDAMFSDLRRDTLYSRLSDERIAASSSSPASHEFMHSTPRAAEKSGKNTRAWFSGSTASATGNLKLLHVSDDGAFVSVSNASATQEENIGGFMLQQNVGGHPVAVFRFPPRAALRPATSVTVWSGKASERVHNPPFDYIWTELDKWRTGPECTTILCKPNGQAVAWTIPAPRTIKNYKEYKPTPVAKQTSNQAVKEQMTDADPDSAEGVLEEESNRDHPKSPSTNKPGRPKSTPTVSRSARSSGLLATRTGSAPLRLHQPRPPMREMSEMYEGQAPYHAPWSEDGQDDEERKRPVVKSAPPNRIDPNATLDSERDMLQSAPAGMRGSDDNDELPRKSPGQSARVRLPGTFWPPAEQHKRGMEWIRSQHNVHFLPPMPKAFPCVTPMYRTLNKIR